jgi:hypothetical protein
VSEVKGVTSDSRASELFLGSESEPQCSASSRLLQDLLLNSSYDRPFE